MPVNTRRSLAAKYQWSSGLHVLAKLARYKLLLTGKDGELVFDSKTIPVKSAEWSRELEAITQEHPPKHQRIGLIPLCLMLAELDALMPSRVLAKEELQQAVEVCDNPDFKPYWVQVLKYVFNGPDDGAHAMALQRRSLNERSDSKQAKRTAAIELGSAPKRCKETQKD